MSLSPSVLTLGVGQDRGRWIGDEERERGRRTARHRDGAAAARESPHRGPQRHNADDGVESRDNERTAERKDQRRAKQRTGQRNAETQRDGAGSDRYAFDRLRHAEKG